MTVLLLADGSGAHDARLIGAALLGIAILILLVTLVKVHPFLSLIVGSLVVGVIAGLGLTKTVTSFGNGVGSTVASVGTLIALGAMFGKLLADSGGADQIVDTIVGRASDRTLPWAMALVGMIIGLPMFFEIGLVLLMPVILLVARRSGQGLMRIGIPALAGLSAMHGFVPPHPGPIAAVGLLNADLGRTLGLGIIVAIPCIVLAGPLFGALASRWVNVPVPVLFVEEPQLATVGASAAAGTRTDELGAPPAGYRTSAQSAAIQQANVQRTAGSGTLGSNVSLTSDPNEPGATEIPPMHRPSFPVTIITVLLPVVLMLVKAITDIVDNKGHSALKNGLDFIGTPIIALLIAVLVAMFTLGANAGLNRRQINKSIERSLPPIAGILLIVSAGGGFKQVLVDSGIAKVIASWVTGSTLSPLLLAWLVAVLLRLATGSATVATVTTAGILAPVAHTLSTTHLSLLVLAIGAGSLFFSHVNDAGFWLVKEYFGQSVGETIRSWSLMETILSVAGIVLVLALSVVV